MIQGSGRRESGSSAKTAAEYRDLFPLQHRLRHHLQGGIEPGSPLGQNEGNTVRRAALIRQPVAERLVVLRKAPSISGDDDDAACAACGTFIEHLERGIIQHQETQRTAFQKGVGQLDRAGSELLQPTTAALAKICHTVEPLDFTGSVHHADGDGFAILRLDREKWRPAELQQGLLRCKQRKELGSLASCYQQPFPRGAAGCQKPLLIGGVHA